MFIKVQNLLKKLGDNTIFSGVDLMLTNSRKYGIIGKNGSGKTTFFKVLMGELNPEKGHIEIDPKGAKLAYFSQVLEEDQLKLEVAELDSEKLFATTTFLYLLKTNQELFDLWKKINMPTFEETDYTNLIDQYSEIGGYEFEKKIVDAYFEPIKQKEKEDLERLEYLKLKSKYEGS